MAGVVVMLGALVELRPMAVRIEPVALLSLGTAVFLGAGLIFIRRLTGEENPANLVCGQFTGDTSVNIGHYACLKLPQFFTMGGSGLNRRINGRSAASVCQCKCPI